MNRGGWLLMCAGLWAFAPARGADAPFDFDSLRARSKALASQAYVVPVVTVPEWLGDLSYDELRQIEYGGQNSLWRAENLPFQVQFLHPGFLYEQTVRISEVRGKRAEVLPFRPEHFNYTKLRQRGALPPTMGFAGFRLMYAWGGPQGGLSELGSFLGASYFRFLGQGGGYGLSARGLALNTAEPGPEEFPVFTEFWLEQPAAAGKSLTLYALLDSESVTGAYQFTISPGVDTIVQVKAAVYSRRNAKLFGIAPLTSMYWRGENSTTRSDDFRPEVHDSDGLLIQNGAGEWIWRPLENPRGIRVAAFNDENPRVFGLLQRDRNFDNYQDLEASYHSRPNGWVEPVGAWGRGSIRLVEIPTPNEFNDNIVVTWVPEKLAPPGQPVEFEYRLHWALEALRPPAGYSVATRHGRSHAQEPDLDRFLVDFDGPGLRALKAADRVEPVLTIGAGGKVVQSSLQKNPYNDTWRVAFAVKPDGSGRPVELRCYLRQGTDALTETWSYLWQP